MRKLKYVIPVAAIILFASCDVEKTESGELPEVEVDVETEPGKLPEYNVDWADVNIGTRTKTVKVPKVIVSMEEEEVEVPFIDVQMPEASGESEEQTIRVEAEIEEVMHDINIKKIYATNKNLIVISEIERQSEVLDDNKIRISDQIIINAPDDLSVKHYIIGDRPRGSFNNSYKYYPSENDLEQKVKNATIIYKQ